MTGSTHPPISLETDIEDEPSIVTAASVSTQATAEHPAKIKLRVQNTRSSDVELEFGFTYPFDSIKKTDGPGTIFLVPRYGAQSMLESGIPESMTDDCWKFTGELIIPQSGMNIRLGPREAIEREYVLLMPPHSDVCFPTGEYLYTTTFGFGEGDGNRKQIEWNSTICVSR